MQTEFEFEWASQWPLGNGLLLLAGIRALSICGTLDWRKMLYCFKCISRKKGWYDDLEEGKNLEKLRRRGKRSQDSLGWKIKKKGRKKIDDPYQEEETDGESKRKDEDEMNEEKMKKDNEEKETENKIEEKRTRMYDRR